MRGISWLRRLLTSSKGLCPTHLDFFFCANEFSFYLWRGKHGRFYLLIRHNSELQAWCLSVLRRQEAMCQSVLHQCPLWNWRIKFFPPKQSSVSEVFSGSSTNIRATNWDIVLFDTIVMTAGGCQLVLTRVLLLISHYKINLNQRFKKWEPLPTYFFGR